MQNKNPTTVLDSLNKGLITAMDANNSVVMIGEDILDPYGGAFKVTRGLSTAYPERVMTSPISEAGIIGIAGGMALRGLRPVVEIMFGDFLTLGADQIINHLTKFREMYNNQVRVPVLIRTPMGGRRGYGPTHSQTLEKHFLGVPGLQVIAPFHFMGNNPIGYPGALLSDLILKSNDPVLFIENKLQYLLPLITPELLNDQICEEVSGIYPGMFKVIVGSAPPPEVTLVAYGYMAHLAMQAQHKLAFECEIFTELIIPTQLAPFELEPVFTSVQATRKLLTIEEGPGGLGWGAEIVALTSEKLGSTLTKASRICAESCPVPAARHLEEIALPQVETIIKSVQKMV
ncbi:MAG: hypothetical protein MUO40_12145 [Anaerolineaceae bacterium]|nr:hypothetical protein [Anaerolineaceae bacterium]